MNMILSIDHFNSLCAEMKWCIESRKIPASSCVFNTNVTRLVEIFIHFLYYQETEQS